MQVISRDPHMLVTSYGWSIQDSVRIQSLCRSPPQAMTAPRLATLTHLHALLSAKTACPWPTVEADWERWAGTHHLLMLHT